MGKVIFITGTDTGAGKTILTALLLTHLQGRSCVTWAMKPFCSGPRSDVDLLYKLQEGRLSKSLINPFYFKESVAPLVSARRHDRQIGLQEVVERIRVLESQSDVLLVEGVGGLLAPLGEGFTVADIIKVLNCSVVVVARNKLGVINHVLLTVHLLKTMEAARICVVLMGCKIRSLAVQTNRSIIEELLWPMKTFSLPFLGESSIKPLQTTVKKFEKKIKKTLARIVETVILTTL